MLAIDDAPSSVPAQPSSRSVRVISQREGRVDFSEGVVLKDRMDVFWINPDYQDRLIRAIKKLVALKSRFSLFVDSRRMFLSTCY